MSTEDVLSHHLQAFSAGDAEEAAKDYDDQSVLITQDGQIVGRAAIKEAMMGFFSGLFKPGTYEFTLDKTEIAGDVAFITWHADTASHEIPMGTDTLVVRDGRIAAQTFAAQMIPK
ncbi:MAG TPA: nuclear transport factor 2 family protein [Acidimicrobiales bacterium]|jgi:ketosteroid isomerase-like protein